MIQFEALELSDNAALTRIVDTHVLTARVVFAFTPEVGQDGTGGVGTEDQTEDLLPRPQTRRLKQDISNGVHGKIFSFVFSKYSRRGKCKAGGENSPQNFRIQTFFFFLLIAHSMISCFCSPV